MCEWYGSRKSFPAVNVDTLKHSVNWSVFSMILAVSMAYLLSHNLMAAATDELKAYVLYSILFSLGVNFPEFKWAHCLGKFVLTVASYYRN